MRKTDIGLIGLAVMGENLVLNLESKGYSVSVYNRTKAVTDGFIRNRAIGKSIFSYYTLFEFINSISLPRKIIIMVKAGEAVDAVVEQILPLLTPGDIIIDGGNSFYKDTERRIKIVESKGVFYIGAGISGGEEGALNGPSIMPGGSKEAWPLVESILMKIAAKADDGSPCCRWIGPGGSGHFVKMVHNGIEYADMQLIAEVYHVLKVVFNFDNEQIAKYFTLYNKGKLKSFLMEITAEILTHRDNSGGYLVDKILDSAGQKGTGRWSVESAMELGVPFNIIATSVFERILSTQIDDREKGEQVYGHQIHKVVNSTVEDIFKVMYCSRVALYSQGFDLLDMASKKFEWDLNLSSVAEIWRNGCIIRSAFLDDISAVFRQEESSNKLLMTSSFADDIIKLQDVWKNVVSEILSAGESIPVMSASLNYFLSTTSKNLPANLIQAQRDFFGAHTFERVDRPRGEFFHEEWKRNQ